MRDKLKCIMLIDDNEDDNFMHARLIRKNGFAERIIIRDSVPEALTYLRSTSSQDYILPDIILLDVNMPGMDGWDFLEEYNQLDPRLRSRAIAMLTMSNSSGDHSKAEMNGTVYRILAKPLQKEMVEEIIENIR